MRASIPDIVTTIVFGNIIYRIPYLRPSERLHRIALLGVLHSRSAPAEIDTETR
jgi:hypothetical protein